ncbi:hypothetical protein ABZ897_30475 [Nonomuraea sp. NPDC046802]|uniref:hypothetical protein n=1 Tax=Nonomuraea sp. NPDC046802 TaxID=3154919 RepID=UPI0033C6708C
MQSLRTHLEAIRGRPITLTPLSGLDSGGPCGIWVATPAVDFVLYRDNTSPVHRSHIILHELSHLIFEHAHVLEGDYRQLLLPNLGDTAIQRILGRTAYAVREEREAETLASLLAGLIAREVTGPDDDGRDQRLHELLK